MKRALALVIVAGALVAGGCSSSDTSGSQSTSTETPTTTTAATSETETEFASVGQQATNGGIALTVNKVDVVNNYRKVANMQIKSSPYIEWETVTAPAGSQFVSIAATVVNKTGKTIDLSCGWAVNAILADTQKNQYSSTVDDLNRVEGVPDCGDDLNPGLSSDMVWVYETPADAVPLAFGFADPSLDSQNFTLVTL